MSIEYQKCRARGHAWDDFIAPKNSHKTIYESPLQETLRCIRCTCERYRGIGYTGEVESNYYDYPTDYLMTAEDRPELIVVRLSLVTEIRAAARQTQRTRGRAHSPAKKKAATTHKKAPRKGTSRRATPRRRAARARA